MLQYTRSQRHTGRRLLPRFSRVSQPGWEFGASSRTGGSVSRKNEPQVRILVFRCCHNLLYSIFRAAIVPPGELCGIEQPGSSPAHNPEAGGSNPAPRFCHNFFAYIFSFYKCTRRKMGAFFALFCDNIIYYRKRRNAMEKLNIISDKTLLR